MGHVITAQKTSICATCGEQVIPGDRIRLQGQGTGLLHIKAGCQVIGGRSSHEECASENPNTAPHISWEQAENLLEIVTGIELPTGNVAVRRLIAACRAAKRTRFMDAKKAPTDPALPMSDAYMEAYRTILRLTHHTGEWWRPYSRMTGERWVKPQVPAPVTEPAPGNEPLTPEEAWKVEQARRARVAAFMEKHQRRA